MASLQRNLFCPFAHLECLKSSLVLQVVGSCQAAEGNQSQELEGEAAVWLPWRSAVISRANEVRSEGTGAGDDGKGTWQQRGRGLGAGAGWRRGKTRFGVRGEDLEKS